MLKNIFAVMVFSSPFLLTQIGCGSGGSSCGGSNFNSGKVTVTYTGSTSDAPGVTDAGNNDKVNVNCGGCGSTSGTVTISCTADSTQTTTIDCASGLITPSPGTVPAGSTGCVEGFHNCPLGALTGQCSTGN